MRRVVDLALHKFFQFHFLGQRVQCGALHEFAARVCEKSFAFAIEVMVEDVAYSSFENGIAQEFESLIVQRFSVTPFVRCRLVYQCCAIELYVSRIEAQNAI